MQKINMKNGQFSQVHIHVDLTFLCLSYIFQARYSISPQIVHTSLSACSSNVVLP